jgi:hypothetical protein
MDLLKNSQESEYKLTANTSQISSTSTADSVQQSNRTPTHSNFMDDVTLEAVHLLEIFLAILEALSDLMSETEAFSHR